MKYSEFKRIAESEGFKLHIDPEYSAGLILDDKNDKALDVVRINLNRSGLYSMDSFENRPISVRMATAIAEFAWTPWIEREVPDKEDAKNE